MSGSGLAAAVLVLASTSAAGASTTAAATHDSVRWQGRTLRNTNGTVGYSYAGVSFHFTVQGATTASMVYSSTFPKGAAELRIYVDGKLAVGGNITLGNSVPSATPARVVLAEGLAAGSSHNITGVYITDPITLSWDTLPAGFAQTAHSFTTDGAIAPQPPIVAGAQRRFDIYGDSITAGNQINPATCQPDWAGTYGKLLCEDFGANCTCAAISGKGIFHNCCDDDVTMNVLGLRILPGDSATEMTKAYYAAAGKPAGILINLGTNDWGHVKGNTSGFVAVYSDFVETLAGLHNWPAVKAPVFFLGVGPITHAYLPSVNQIVAAMAGKGIVAHAVDMTTPVDRCGHPPYNSHVMMYEQARPIIANALGWD